MLKYLIFVIIGIIVYLLYNRNDTFSVGILWCIVQNDAPDVILNSVNIATLPPNGMLNISPNLANLGLSSDQYSVKRCNNIDSQIVLQTVPEGVPYCSVNFGKNTELDILTHYLEQHPDINRIYTFLTQPPTIPEYNGINSINLYNTSLEDLILLKEAAEGNRTGMRNRVFLLTNFQRNIIDIAIDLKRELSINPDLNRVYNSLFDEGVFDPNRLDTLSNPDIDILMTIINLVYLSNLQLLIRKRKYLIDNPEFAIVYNRVINPDGSINSQASLTDIETVYTVSNSEKFDGKRFLVTDTQRIEYLSLFKFKYLEDNQVISSLYYRIYAYVDGPINPDSINQMRIEELVQLRDAKYHGDNSLIDSLNDKIVYTLINSRIFALSYRLDTNIIGINVGQADIVAIIEQDGDINIKEYSDDQISEYGLPLITKEELVRLDTYYYLISTELEEKGIFIRSIQVTGTLVGIGGKNDNITSYLSVLASSFGNPRYFPIDAAQNQMSQLMRLLNLYKSQVNSIKNAFETLDFTLPRTQIKPNILQIPAWLDT